MQRRLVITVLALAPACALHAQDEPPRPRHTISAATLHRALSTRFPVRAGVAGLLVLELGDPRLLLLPAHEQIGATLVARASGAAIEREAAGGELDLMFRLRYEPSDRSIRAHDPQLRDLRWPGMPPELLRALQRLLPDLAREALGELVLHRLTAADLALPDTLGVEPDRLAIAHEGVVIHFAPKRRP